MAHWLKTFVWSDKDAEEAHHGALQWALLRGSGSGRVASKFARDWAGKQGTRAPRGKR